MRKMRLWTLLLVAGCGYNPNGGGPYEPDWRDNDNRGGERPPQNPVIRINADEVVFLVNDEEVSVDDGELIIEIGDRVEIDLGQAVDGDVDFVWVVDSVRVDFDEIFDNWPFDEDGEWSIRCEVHDRHGGHDSIDFVIVVIVPDDGDDDDDDGDHPPPPNNDNDNDEPPQTRPWVDIDVDPIDIDEGGCASLTWRSQRADSCTVTGPAGFTASGAAGQATVCPAVGAHAYHITCVNEAGEDSDTARLDVNDVCCPPPPPTAPRVDVKVRSASGGNFTDGPLTVTANDLGLAAVVVFWDSAGVARLIGTGAWSGDKQLFTSEQSLSLQVGTHAVVLTGYNASNQAVVTDSVTVVVLSHQDPPPPDPLTASITSPSNNSIHKVGDSVDFTVNVSGGTPPYSFHWQFYDRVVITETMSHTVRRALTYDTTRYVENTVRVTDAVGNEAMTSVSILVNP